MMLPLPCLMLVTPTGVDDACLDAALQGGVNVVQLRDREVPSQALYERAVTLRRMTRGRALLLVNDRIDVALAADADGVQLPERGMKTPVARRLAPHLLLGRSVHGTRGDGDFLVAGTLYPVASQPGSPALGPSLVAELGRASRTPVIGIGGIGVGQAREVMAHGAAGVAVTSAILQSPDPCEAARALVAALGPPRRLT